MDYEQKYKAALEKAGKELQTCGSKDCDAARQIYRFFPELQDLEDERIRKAIIEFFEFQDDNTTYSLVSKKDILAWLEKQGEQKPADKVEPKFKVKYAGNEYNVFETKDIAGVTFYGIEDEPNHIDYVKAENCEIISVYAIKENGSPYPTKPAVFSEKKPKRMISAEAKECIYGSDNEQVSSEKIGKNDTLLDLLHKMPSCITVDGIDYHFVMAKSSYYIAYYKGNKEKYSGNTIFGVTAFSPIDLLTAMFEKLKEEGLLE